MKAFMMFGRWPLVEVLRTYQAPDGNPEADIRYLDGPEKGIETGCGQCVLIYEYQVRSLLRRIDG